jgi:hypothetical protein
MAHSNDLQSIKYTASNGLSYQMKQEEINYFNTTIPGLPLRNVSKYFIVTTINHHELYITHNLHCCLQSAVESNILSQPIVSEIRPNLSLSSVSELTANNSNLASTIQCDMQWKRMKQNTLLEHENNRKKIDIYVKDELFKMVKFIPAGETMQFSTKKQSLCQLICDEFNIPSNERCNYWENYSRCIEKSINGARNDAVAAVKKSFFKGWYLLFIAISFGLSNMSIIF